MPSESSSMNDKKMCDKKEKELEEESDVDIEHSKREIKQAKRHTSKTIPVIQHISKNGVVKQVKDKRYDRKSRGNQHKSSNKKIEDEINFSDELDENDPNFDDEENVVLKEVTVKMDTEKFNSILKQLLLEYFNHYQPYEIEEYIIEEALDDDILNDAVKMILMVAVDQKPLQKELVSVLLGDLSIKKIIFSNHFESAFVAIFNGIEDILLDSPQAVDNFTKFIARAIADDCIPPRFIYHPLETTLSPNDLSYFKKAIDKAIELISRENGIASLDSVWCQSISNIRPVRSLCKEIIKILQNYLNDQTAEDTQKALKTLQIPHFFHEVVYEAFLLCHNDINKYNRIKKLVLFFFECGFFTAEQIQSGVKRINENIDEFSKNELSSYENLEDFLKELLSIGAIDKELVEFSPLSKGRKRYISEGDGGKIKPQSF